MFDLAPSGYTASVRLRPVIYLILFVVLSGCEPMVDVAGVYFPGWLVATVVGVLSSYGIVAVLARNATTRNLADSGLFFISLTVIIALIDWWIFFSSF